MRAVAEGGEKVSRQKGEKELKEKRKKTPGGFRQGCSWE